MSTRRSKNGRPPTRSYIVGSVVIAENGSEQPSAGCLASVAGMVSRPNDWTDPAIAQYVAERAKPRPDAVLAELRAETAALGHVSGMQVGSDQGSLLTALTRLRGGVVRRRGRDVHRLLVDLHRPWARTGRALLCCDVSEEYTAIARRAWERAGVADRIELRIAPALETLRACRRRRRSTSPSSTPTSRTT